MHVGIFISEPLKSMNYENQLRETDKQIEKIMEDIHWSIDLLGDESKRRGQGISTNDIFVDFTSSLGAFIHLAIQKRELRGLANLPLIEGLY